MALLLELGNPLDQAAFALAVEAVVGTMACGKHVHPKDQKPAHDWVVAALDGHDSDNVHLARTMYFVSRILDGPKPIV